jgi:CheY-like chemotaxis protein
VAKTTVLFADNNVEFLQTWKEFLEREGFQVFPALDPVEARNILEQRHVDLVIVDIRLLNDDDDKDISGLNLAKRVAPSVPKIILTRFPTYDAVREALGPQLVGLPPAVDFIAKQDGPQALLTAVRKVLKLESRFLETLKGISDQIKADYEDARQQARVNYWASVSVSIVGIITIFVGIGLAMGDVLAVGILSAVAGVIAEAVSLLFFKRADTANERMDKYHNELLETRQFDNLLAACDELVSSERQELCKEKVIEAAQGLWFGAAKVKIAESAQKNDRLEGKK